MTLEEIKQNVQDGITVYWGNNNYTVILDRKGQYMIECVSNGNCIGLTWLDGVTLNGKQNEFFTA